MNGGYAMIDFGGIDLAGDSVEIAGIHNAAKNAADTGKPLILCGVVIDSKAFTPIPAYAAIDGTNIVLFITAGRVTIAADDTITFAE